MTTTNTPLWMTDEEVNAFYADHAIRYKAGCAIRDKAQTIISDLTAKVEAKDEENTEYAFELQKYEGIVVNLQSENATLRSQLEAKEKEVKFLGEALAKASKPDEEIAEKWYNTKQENATLKAEVEELRKQVKNWPEANKMASENATLKAEVERLKGELEKEMQGNDKLQVWVGTLEKLEDERDLLKKQVEFLEKDNERFNAEYSKAFGKGYKEGLYDGLNK